MTKIELAREIAARSPTRTVEIPRVRVLRHTAYENMKRKWAEEHYAEVVALLYQEQERLIKKWKKEEK